MRLLVRKLHRAFPELDGYSDEQCQRFVTAANRGSFRFILRLPLIFLAGSITAVFAGLVCWMSVTPLLILTLSNAEVAPDWVAIFLAAIVITIMSGAFGLGALHARDEMMSRRIAGVFRSNGRCPSCDYVLLGLPVSASRAVTCPECGMETTVDESLGELVRDEGGRRVVPDPSAAANLTPPAPAPDSAAPDA